MDQYACFLVHMSLPSPYEPITQSILRPNNVGAGIYIYKKLSISFITIYVFGNVSKCRSNSYKISQFNVSIGDSVAQI